MRHVLGVLAAALLLAFPAPAGASHDSSSDPPIDFARGNGTLTVGPGVSHDFRFDASSGPLGEHPAGSMFVDGPAFSVRARVTCLAVHDNRATLIGKRTGGTGVPDATGVAFFVEDDSPDKFAFQLVTSTQLAPPCVAFGSITPISSGEIVVHDGQPQNP
jgi:hypothetical protein